VLCPIEIHLFVLCKPLVGVLTVSRRKNVDSYPLNTGFNLIIAKVGIRLFVSSSE